MNVRIICDNSLCNRNIISFKIKLGRNYRGKDGFMFETKGEKNLISLNEDGCKAHTKFERTYTVKVPADDEFHSYGTLKDRYQDDDFTYKSLTASVSTRLIRVSYFLEVYPEHEVKFFGGFKHLKIPVTILHRPVPILTKIKDVLPYDWNP